MKDKPYTAADLAEVSDYPEWTAKDVREAKPFAEAFPELAATANRLRGPQRAPTKKLISIRLSQDVLERFRSSGPGWPSRIDEALRKEAGL